MCGRFALYDTKDVYQRFSLNPSLLLPKDHNCSPGESLPVIIFDNGYQLDLFRWGITPYWSTPVKDLINIRSETLSQKTTFDKYFQTQRCLIPANGFYEWGTSNGKKVPYYFTPTTSSYFIFGGLYNNHSFAIITTPPNSIVAPIHDRMPLIFDDKTSDLWLDPTSTTQDLIRYMTSAADTSLQVTLS
jgi:putative SOS response-associated peptidase YedK